MSNEIYFPKYLKYKAKYQKAKKKNLQIGGNKRDVTYFDFKGDVKTCSDTQIPPGAIIKISFMPEKYDAIGESYFLSAKDEQFMTDYVLLSGWQTFLSYYQEELKKLYPSTLTPINNIASTIKIVDDILVVVISSTVEETEIRLRLCDLYNTMQRAFYILAADKNLNVSWSTRMEIVF
uniref:Uncharacterized protein n=1 Tax=viral metagenome TaxID=1070528 RepID=A0A6C0C8S3_9ZZZZ